MKHIAALDDYMDQATTSADWSSVRPAVEIVPFRDHLDDEDRLVDRLKGFEGVILFRYGSLFGERRHQVDIAQVLFQAHQKRHETDRIDGCRAAHQRRVGRLGNLHHALETQQIGPMHRTHELEEQFE